MSALDVTEMTLPFNPVGTEAVSMRVFWPQQHLRYIFEPHVHAHLERLRIVERDDCT